MAFVCFIHFFSVNIYRELNKDTKVECDACPKLFMDGGVDQWDHAQMDNAIIYCIRTVLENSKGVMGIRKGAPDLTWGKSGMVK